MIKTGLAVTVGMALASSMFLSSTQAAPAPPNRGAQQAVENLLAALKTNNYNNFVMHADNNVKAALTKTMFEAVVAQSAPRLRKGYQMTYLGHLKQKGYDVSLWKIAYNDKGDDTLAELSLKNNQVGGFFLR